MKLSWILNAVVMIGLVGGAEAGQDHETSMGYQAIPSSPPQMRAWIDERGPCGSVPQSSASTRLGCWTMS